MEFLNLDLIHCLDAVAFQEQTPFPWINPAGFVTETGFARLLSDLPLLGLFQQRFGEVRRHGQESHDRFALDYRADLPIAPAWHAFVRELNGPVYRSFIARMFGRDDFRLRFHWHYTSAGCSVSPHCDARRKIGSHIFYLNTENDWRPEWGGETLILDGVGRIPMNSAPRFEDFADAKPAATLGNRSLLLMRRPHSWHGVKRLACPPHALRKVFIVVVEDWSLPARLRALVRTRNRGGY